MANLEEASERLQRALVSLDEAVDDNASRNATLRGDINEIVIGPRSNIERREFPAERSARVAVRAFGPHDRPGSENDGRVIDGPGHAFDPLPQLRHVMR